MLQKLKSYVQRYVYLFPLSSFERYITFSYSAFVSGVSKMPNKTTLTINSTMLIKIPIKYFFFLFVFLILLFINNTQNTISNNILIKNNNTEKFSIFVPLPKCKLIFLILTHSDLKINNYTSIIIISISEVTE